MASKIIEIDLAKSLQPVWGMEGYGDLYAMVRYRRRFLGWVSIKKTDFLPVLSADRLREAIMRELHWPFAQALLQERLGSDQSEAPLPPISVVICSEGKPEQLRRCLTSLFVTQYPHFEVIVLSSKADEALVQTASCFPARHIRQERPGIDLARNHGIDLSRHDIIAFTTDRACPDRQWLPQIGRTFMNQGVEAVTGLVAPLELETLAQIHLEFDVGVRLKLQEFAFCRDVLRDSELLGGRHLGSGANMAFRRRIFSQIGGFDPGLSADASGDGTGDIEMLHRLVARGHTLQYQPGAIVWLAHKRSDYFLRRWLYDNGRYYGAYLLTCSRNRTVSRTSILRFFLQDWLFKHLLRRMLKPHGIRRSLVFQELRGTLLSPVTYRKGRAFASEVGGLQPQRPPGAENPLGPPPPFCKLPARAEGGISGQPGAVPIRVIRTWYPHWGRYAGINQFLRFLDRQKFDVWEHLVQENDNDFWIQNTRIRNWLRHRIQRNGMPWYNLSDFCAEMRTLPLFIKPRQAPLLHYLDGEHSAQFLPRLLKYRCRPSMIATYHQPPDVLERVVRKDILQQMDRITVVAPEQDEFLRTLVEPAKVRLILHGIDTEFFHPASDEGRDATVKCVTVGHNYRDYRVLGAVAERLRTVPQVEFYVVSPRPTGVEGLPNVRCYRGLTDDQLLHLYQAADILFLPLTKTTANNSLLEGMACGLPILSTSLPSVRTYTSEESAILVKKNDVGQFAEALMYLIENPWVRKRMAAESRKRAEDLSWRNIALLFESIYSEVTPRQGGTV
jgi:glycosyltransferase involved in cell wall biosynthesis